MVIEAGIAVLVAVLAIVLSRGILQLFKVIPEAMRRSKLRRATAIIWSKGFALEDVLEGIGEFAKAEKRRKTRIIISCVALCLFFLVVCFLVWELRFTT